MSETAIPGKILVVDNAVNTLDIMKTDLEKEGYVVYAAAAGKQAVEKFIGYY